MAEISTLTQFWEAVARGDDARAETLAARLAADAEPVLLAALGDETGDADRRWWAVRALAHCGTAAAPPAAARALDDPDASVRAAASLALAWLCRRHPEAGQPLLPALAARLADPDGLVRQVAADALAQCGDTAVPVLGEVIRGAAEAPRVRAAYALRKIGTLRAAALLYPLLNDPNPLIRTYAHEGLDDLGLLENVLLLP
jgi:HEAT repeat protein